MNQDGLNRQLDDGKDEPSREAPERVGRLLPELIAHAEAPRFSGSLGPSGQEEAMAFYALRSVVMAAASRENGAGGQGSSRGAAPRPQPATKSGDYSAALLQAARASLARDFTSQMAVSVLARYFASPAPANYLVLGGFFKRFRGVRLGRLTYAHLPRAAAAYVELPEVVKDCFGHSFSGFFFYSGPTAELFGPLASQVEFTRYPVGTDCVAMAYLDRCDFSLNYVVRPFPLDETMTIADSLEGTFYHETAAGGPGPASMSPLEGYPEHARLLFNLLAYLQSGTPDLREYRNAPRLRGGPGSKPVNADKGLSTLDLTMVGFDYKKGSLYETAEWEVSTHLRAVPSGPGGSGARLVWVRQHTRQRREGLAMGAGGATGADRGNEGARPESASENQGDAGGHGNGRESGDSALPEQPAQKAG